MEWKNNSNIKKEKHTRIARNRIVEDFMIVETGKTLDCFDLARSSNVFQKKEILGIKICFQNSSNNGSLIVSCICDELILQACSEPFVFDTFKLINSNKPKDKKFFINDFDRFINSLTLRTSYL